MSRIRQLYEAEQKHSAQCNCKTCCEKRLEGTFSKDGRRWDKSMEKKKPLKEEGDGLGTAAPDVNNDSYSASLPNSVPNSKKKAKKQDQKDIETVGERTDPHQIRFNQWKHVAKSKGASSFVKHEEHNLTHAFRDAGGPKECVGTYSHDQHEGIFNEAYKPSKRLLGATKYLVQPQLSQKLKDRLAKRAAKKAGEEEKKGYKASASTIGLARQRRAKMSYTPDKGYDEQVVQSLDDLEPIFEAFKKANKTIPSPTNKNKDFNVSGLEPVSEGKRIEESSKVKRKYLGAARGRTATGKPAHKIEVEPVIGKSEKNQNRTTPGGPKKED